MEAKWHLQFLDNPNTYIGPYASRKQAEFMQSTYKVILKKETKAIQK